MDYIAIKNFRYMQIAFQAQTDSGVDTRQDYLTLC